MLKIIGGSVGGLKLLTPSGKEARPMIARVRKSLFAIIEAELDDKNGLDLFSGTGALGIEALSRGAKYVTFIERSPSLVKIIHRNIEKAYFKERSKVIHCDAFKPDLYLNSNTRPDFVFVDPPYIYFDDPSLKLRLVNFLSQLSYKISPNGFFVLHYRRDSMKGFPFPYPLTLEDERAYGTTEIAIVGIKV